MAALLVAVWMAFFVGIPSPSVIRAMAEKRTLWPWLTIAMLLAALVYWSEMLRLARRDRVLAVVTGIPLGLLLLGFFRLLRAGVHALGDWIISSQ